MIMWRICSWHTKELDELETQPEVKDDYGLQIPVTEHATRQAEHGNLHIKTTGLIQCHVIWQEIAKNYILE